MKTYNATYKFEKNGIIYEAKVNGQIFEKANEEISLNHVSDLKKGFAICISDAVLYAISDGEQGMFLNGEPLMVVETQLMQNDTESYSVLVDGCLFPISMNINIEVSYGHYELLK